MKQKMLDILMIVFGVFMMMFAYGAVPMLIKL